jgi:asparagine synthase (glutamine-hydrolysing)
VCGIAGVLGPPDDRSGAIAAREAQAVEMIERLAHRGPNGIRVEAVKGSALAHARLSIIDLEGGWQPLHAAGSTVIGNGEIYNYVELIEEFGLRDRLKTGSDFEPLLHLYALEGEAAFARLRGMYAFCLIGGDGRTWLVRDPFGIKPLYVRQEAEGVAFASERRALGLGEIGRQKAVEVLTLGYGVDDGGLSALPKIARGSVLEWAGGQLEPRGSLRALPPPPAHPRGSGDPGLSRSPIARPNSGKGGAAAQTWIPASAGMSGSEGGWIAKLDAVLEDSVRVHQRSDVPYGLFLSGGIDSTAIATLMSRLNERPVTAFTSGFDIPEAADERGQAERVAKALNLDWRETTFTAEDFWRIAPEVAWALDDPTTDYACLPTYKLAEAAKGTLTVVLSGEGGDELFAGYGRYRRALRPKWLGGRPAEPQVDAPFLKDGGAAALARWRDAASPPPGLTPLQQAQWADIATWLPNDLLLKLDRMLMAHGLEGRTPFLDREVAAFAWSLPDRLKVRGRYGKWILRKWLERACPAAEPWARKQGFTVPVARWIAPRAADLGPRIAAVQGVAEVCDVDSVRAVFADPAHGKHWWPLLFYALWWTIHVEGASPAEAAERLGF